MLSRLLAPARGLRLAPLLRPTLSSFSVRAVVWKGCKPLPVALPHTHTQLLDATRYLSTEAETADKENRALLDYFLKMDEKDAAAVKPEAPLPIKVSGISGGLAAELFRGGKGFDKVVGDLQELVNIVNASEEVVARFFRHPNYSPEECQAVVGLLFTADEPLKKFDAIKDEELREVIVQSEAAQAHWLKARAAIKAVKASPPTRGVVDRLAAQGRLDLVKRVAEITQDIQTAQSNTVPVTVASATELSADQKKQVTAALPKYLEKDQKIDVTFEVDSGTLGGLMVTMGNRSIDLTSGTRLMEAMQEHA